MPNKADYMPSKGRLILTLYGSSFFSSDNLQQQQKHVKSIKQIIFDT